MKFRSGEISWSYFALFKKLSVRSRENDFRIQKLALLHPAVINHETGKSGCSVCSMEEVQVSIHSTPLPALNLYYRCKAVSAQLKVSSETLRATARHGSPRHAIIYEQSCQALRDRSAKFVISLSILDMDSDCLKYRSKIVAWV